MAAPAWFVALLFAMGAAGAGALVTLCFWIILHLPQPAPRKSTPGEK